MPGLLVWLGVLLLMAGGIAMGVPRLFRPTVLPLDPPGPASTSTPTLTVPSAPTWVPSATPPSTPADPPLPTPALPSPTPTPALYPPTRIVVPSVGIDAPITPTTWTVGEEGMPIWLVPDAPYAGWHLGSATLGMPGNTVINGHNWPEDGVFRFLYQVRVGDPILLYSGRVPFVYEVREILILKEAGQPLEVRQENARYIQPTDDERVTLVTCHPYGSTHYRLIVIAHRAKADLPPGSE
ncbi:MAG: sortase [Anaerolineae bacterium]|nr:sortase [Anaerolineae bacterium]